MKRVLVILVLAVLTSAMAPAGSSDAEVAPQRDVLVIGDSIALGAESQIVSRFADLGWTARVDAEVSRPTQTGIDIVAGIDGELPPHVVVALGANDGGSRAFGGRVEQMIGLLADVPNVYWVNVAEVRDYYPTVNAAIAGAVERRDDLVVLDWNSMALPRPHLTAADGLHLTGAGGDAYASMVVFGVVANENDRVRGATVKRVVRGTDVVTPLG